MTGSQTAGGLAADGREADGQPTGGRTAGTLAAAPERQAHGAGEAFADPHLAPIPEAWPWWDGSPLPGADRLRWGFSTGACLVAALTASFLALHRTGPNDREAPEQDSSGPLPAGTQGQPGSGQQAQSRPQAGEQAQTLPQTRPQPGPPSQAPDLSQPGPQPEPQIRQGRVDVLFGDRIVRSLPLGPALPEYPGFMVVRKNAGDDPDCTHGLLVAARLVPLPPEGGTARDGDDPRDIVLAVGAASVRLHALCGVGLATRRGLDCEQGRWAINAGVLRMLKENLARCGLAEGHYQALIAVPQGAELAGRTLNASLGVTGGLSLLGTTGLVRPLSHEAYVATVRVCLRCAAERSASVVLCTGRRTLETARALCCQNPPGQGCPDIPGLAVLAGLPEEALVSMADFVGESLRAAAGLGFARILIACMPGKLLKYAAGLDNTHAHRAAQDRGLLADTAAALFAGTPELAARISAEPGMRAAMEHLDDGQQDALLAFLADRALERLARLLEPREATQSSAPAAKTLPALALLVTDTARGRTHFFPGPGFVPDRDVRKEIA